MVKDKISASNMEENSLSCDRLKNMAAAEDSAAVCMLIFQLRLIKKPIVVLMRNITEIAVMSGWVYPEVK